MLIFVLAGGILLRFFDKSQHADIPNHRPELFENIML